MIYHETSSQLSYMSSNISRSGGPHRAILCSFLEWAANLS